MAGWPLTQLNGCVGGLLLTHWRHQKSDLPIKGDYCTFFGRSLLISLTLFLFLWWASAFFGLDSKPPPTRFLFRAVLDRILSRCHLFSSDLVQLRGSRLLSNVSSPFSLHEKVLDGVYLCAERTESSTRFCDLSLPPLGIGDRDAM